MKTITLIGILLLSTVLAACSFSLAADITPPPGYQSPSAAPPQTEPVSAPLYPLVPPDPAAGAAIFVEKCAPCHGDTGQGDGPRAAQLPNPVSPIGQPDYARLAAPAMWFDVVTQGNLERFMPPFPSLDDRQRWDVIAYTLGLSEPPESLAQGQQLFVENCAGCHGELGRGDGPAAGELQMPSFSDQEYMAAQPALAFYDAIAKGRDPGMPAFADRLDDQQMWALAAYLRSLSMSSTAGPGEQAVVQSTPAPGELPEPTSTVTDTQVISPTLAIGTITGLVTNLSGGELPAAEEVMLHGFDNMQISISQTVPLAPDGSYAFENIELPPGRMFITSLQHEGVTYGSEVATVEAGQQVVDLPVSIYDTTSDPSALKIDRLHLFFEQIDQQTMRVTELFVLSNGDDKTIVPSAPDQPAVRFKLPAGAANLEFQDGELGGRFIQTEDGFGDLASIYPGNSNYQLLARYTLPYKGKVNLQQELNYPADALVILVPQDNFKVKGAGLEQAGVSDVDGVPYQLYNGASIAAGGEIDMTVSSSASFISGPNISLLIGLAALMLVVVIAGVWLIRQQQLRSAGQLAEMPAVQAGGAEFDSDEALMDAILALDDQYQDGNIPEAAYRQRRADLKAQLQARLD